MFHSLRKGGDICFILNSSSSVCNKTDLGGRLDVPLLRLLQLDEAGLQQTPPTFFNHYGQKTRDRLKLESLCAPLMLLGLVKVREILHRELELTSRSKKLNLIWFPFSRLHSFSAATEDSMEATPPTVPSSICICSTLKHFHCRKHRLIVNYVAVKLKRRVVFQCFYFNHI